ncbi:hypothetical protein [Nocardia cyriacigeorgica]|uniref:hypothetical protein n=1 Tax=Nocardia cyriacigeorgica TaxID=135487 RepID=UPI002115404C|nr:hypothetical protein [Nocardia cyriacigeorgica]
MKPSDVRIDGNATFTTEISSTTMNCAAHTTDSSAAAGAGATALSSVPGRRTPTSQD